MSLEQKIISFARDPEWRRIFEKMIKAEEENESKGYMCDWEWHEINTPPHVIRKLVYEGIVEITHKSNKHTYYRLVDRELTKQILQEIEKIQETRIDTVKEEKIPDDLFEIIAGYDDIKRIMWKIIKKKARVHILLVGPPATAKTLFLLEFSRLPNAFYVLGGSTTKAGLTDALFQLRPTYVLVDEIDKMDTTDLTALLSLMETGIVKETKYGKTREMKLDAVVIAACNRVNGLPAELLSRFMQFHIREYDNETLKNVIVSVLTKRHKKTRELAEYIAEKIIYDLGSKDVRDAIKIAQLCDTKEEVDEDIKTWKKYRR